MDQSREGRELWRIMQMSSHDVLPQYFENDKVRMHFARVAGENLVSPDEKATGIGTFVFVGFLEAYGIGVPIGGSGKLTDALIACIRDKGGEVLANVDVERVIVKNGRAQGAHTKDGRDFMAKDGVIGAIHPHHLGRMVAGLDPLIVRDAEATEISSVACITIHAALNGPLKFKAGDHVRAVMIELLPNRYEQLRRSFDDMRYGGFSKYPLVGLGSRRLDTGHLQLDAGHVRGKRRPQIQVVPVLRYALAALPLSDKSQTATPIIVAATPMSRGPVRVTKDRSVDPFRSGPGQPRRTSAGAP